MVPSQRTRFSLFKRKEATKNKVVIDVSDDEVIEVSEIFGGWNVDFSYQGPTQNLSKTYCDICSKEITKGEKSCDMCFVIASYTNDCELFGYNSNAPASPTTEWGEDTTNSHMITSPEPKRKYCAFCGWEISEEEDVNCKECTLQAVREKNYNILGYVPYQYNISSPEEEPLSPATQEMEYINMVEEEEEDPEEEEMEEEKDFYAFEI